MRERTRIGIKCNAAPSFIASRWRLVARLIARIHKASAAPSVRDMIVSYFTSSLVSLVDLNPKLIIL